MDNIFIQKFEILGLFGYKDVSITFKYPTLIIIGENGFGKTTILNALNFLITRSYKRLLEIMFRSIHLTINNQIFTLDRALLEHYVSYLNRHDSDEYQIIDFIKRNADVKVFQTAVSLINEGKRKEFYNYVNNDDFLKTIPGNVLYQELFTWNEQMKAFSDFRKMESLIDNYGYTVLFYPTYRRVEVDYQSLFPTDERSRNTRFDRERFDSHQDLSIRFGMRDVAKRIESITDIIRKSSLEGFTNVSGDVIHQMLDKDSQIRHELNCTQEELRVVLDRTGQRLNEYDKQVILTQFNDHDSALFRNDFLLFYLEQLLMIYRGQEKYDSAINKYCEVCNKYLADKKFVYDASNVTLDIYRCVDGKPNVSPENLVHLSQLSSGEKQIVSIFSQIYLDIDKKFIVLFDEPELSLSIYWQENLLPDIIASGNCMFLMAVTHSPFIFGDELEKYTVGMRELIKE